MAYQKPLTEYDQRILQITEELCLQLNILNYNPTFVSWETVDSRSRKDAEFRYDDCLIEKYCITLSARMKEVLEPDEWRPIIASALISSKKLRGRGIRVTGISFVGLVILAIILSPVLPIFFSLALAIIGTFLISIILARKLRSEADKRAVEIVSADQFLAVLGKISDAMTQSGYQAERYGYSSTLTFLPDIQTRIARLKRYTHHS